MHFNEIPQLTRDGGYEVNMPLDYIDDKIVKWEEEESYKLEINPDFQRGHVWKRQQQVDFVEYFLRGGTSGRILYFNKPSWMGSARCGYDDFVLVDGLQRLTALRKFITGKNKAFGLYVHEFEGKLRQLDANSNMRFNVNTLQTKKQVLKWYIEMNTGGKPHTKGQINKVRVLLDEED